jgi:hypothetical protein
MLPGCTFTDLICFVIVLWVIFEELLLLRIRPVRQYFIQLALFPPILAFDEPREGTLENAALRCRMQPHTS